MQPSGFLKLNWRDLLRGLIIVVGAFILGDLGPILQAGHLPTLAQLAAIGIKALSTIVSYMLLNLFTPGKPESRLPAQGNGV